MGESISKIIVGVITKDVTYITGKLQNLAIYNYFTRYFVATKDSMFANKFRIKLYVITGIYPKSVNLLNIVHNAKCIYRNL